MKKLVPAHADKLIAINPSDPQMCIAYCMKKHRANEKIKSDVENFQIKIKESKSI